MKIQNIFILIALASITFIGCSKEETVMPSNEDRDTQSQTMDPIGDDEDDEYIIIRPKPKSQQTGQILAGATIDFFNAANSYTGVIDASGNLEFVVPSYGNYTYVVTYNNQVLLTKVVDVQVDVIEIEDYL